MAPNDIRDKLNCMPYQPIRIHVSDGTSYEVHFASDASVNRMEMFIGLDPDTDGIPTKSIYIDPRHVTRIEPLVEGTHGSNEANGERGSDSQSSYTRYQSSPRSTSQLVFDHISPALGPAFTI